MKKEESAWLRANSRTITDEGVRQLRNIRKIAVMTALKSGFDPLELIHEFDDEMLRFDLEKVQAEETKIKEQMSLNESWERDFRKWSGAHLAVVGNVHKCERANIKGEACPGELDLFYPLLDHFKRHDMIQGPFGKLSIERLKFLISRQSQIIDWPAPCRTCKKSTQIQYEMVSE